MATTTNHPGPVITAEGVGFVLALAAVVSIIWRLSDIKHKLDTQIIQLTHQVELVNNTLQSYKNQQSTLADQITLIGNQARELAEHKYVRASEDLARFRGEMLPMVEELRADMKSVKTFLTKNTEYDGD